MKYTIEATNYGCIETIELPNEETYQKRTLRIKGGCRALDEDFAEQLEKAGVSEEIIERVYEQYDDFGALEFMEIEEAFQEEK